MKKYFYNSRIMNLDDKVVLKDFITADAHPESVIRLAMDEKAMQLDYKGKKEYRILEATVVVWTGKNNAVRFEYHKEDMGDWFYAVFKDTGIVINFPVPYDWSEEYAHDFLNSHPSSEIGMFGALKTDNGTILITYEAEKTYGFNFIPYTPEGIDALEQMHVLFNHLLPGMDDEDLDDEE